MRAQCLAVRRWADEVVVYDDHSGDTHVFEDLPGQVLEHLLATSSGADLDELLALFGGASVDEDVSNQRLAQMFDVIEHLQRKGLVKSVRP